jgi:hypothetical protein
MRMLRTDWYSGHTPRIWYDPSRVPRVIVSPLRKTSGDIGPTSETDSRMASTSEISSRMRRPVRMPPACKLVCPPKVSTRSWPMALNDSLSARSKPLP